MPARAACLRRRPRAPDVAPGATARLGFCQFCRFLAGLMIGGHTLAFNAARKALTTVLTGALPGAGGAARGRDTPAKWPRRHRQGDGVIETSEARARGIRPASYIRIPWKSE